ncbi:5'-methylthioadenosine/adenosylhomocysteine nucleosidase [Marinilactibacillus piezotolerans]|uniref:5'-methylthioadenosine/adenosylhomocysteine nucleosidase n=1 Tax=Marinilactibacillus piezotolerans TaxID=258723 RepID=UPI0009B140A9|nr:5'-methylthioadenosine/adenosylhomocysteine nucleosidase [Marinilactibacillus piezotolerans]
MKIGIIAAMEQEVRVLVDHIEHKETQTIANQTFFNGTINHQEVTVVQSGIGKVNAAIATALLIQTFKVDAVMNTGSAGGIKEGLHVGDLVLSTELTYNDVDAQVFGYDFGQVPQMPTRYQADAQLIEQVAAAAEQTGWSIIQGLIVTGDSFIADQKRTSEIRAAFSEALVTEMEGTAVAQTCYQFDVPVIVIRALSDTADEEASVSFDTFIEQAGKQSADMVLQFLTNLSA